MGPSFFKDGNGSRRAEKQHPNTGFNGAILFQGWKLGLHPCPPELSSTLQWGHPFSRMEMRIRLTVPAATTGFNGAILFQGWKYSWRACAVVILACFNGAILFQGWKFNLSSSSGRRSRTLQWGHPFSRMEICGTHRPTTYLVQLQWGHPFSRMEIGWKAVLRVTYDGASMGPSFFKDGNDLVDVVRDTLQHASMGPSFFKDGNSARRLSAGSVTPLQWGHPFSRMEIGMHRSQSRRAFSGFNGAILFQGWKFRRHSSQAAVQRSRFNGAILFQGWKSA